MSIVSVYKCDKTGKLFEDKTKYQTHLKKLAKEARIRSKLEFEKQEFIAQWDEIHNTEISLEQLKDLIILKQSIFWADASVNFRSSSSWKEIGKKTRKGVSMPMPDLVEFTVFDLKYSQSVSNSHCCPKNGITNWWGRKDAPRGYPGWQGRVEWKIRWPKEFEGCYPGSDLFQGEHCCIHSGTGGGGGWKDGYQRFGYDCELFAADWPGLVRYYEKQRLWATIKDQRYDLYDPA